MWDVWDTPIYYIIDEAGYWIDPTHRYKRNWFTNKYEAKERIESFKRIFLFTKSEYYIREVISEKLARNVSIDVCENEIVNLIIAKTNSGLEAQKILENHPEHYLDVDTLINEFKRQCRMINTNASPSVKIPSVSPAKLKEFIISNVQPYEQAHFNKAIDKYFGLIN